MSRNSGKQETETPEKILTSAYECLSTRGYANVSMRDIADKAGVALSQLTYYFKSKEKLFSEVINMMMNQYMAGIEATLKSPRNTKDKVSALVGYFKSLIRNRPNLLRLSIDFAAQALWVPAFREQLDKLFDAITGVIERNLPVNSGADRTADKYSPKHLARLIFGALFGTSIQILLSPDGDEAFEPLNIAEGML